MKKHLIFLFFFFATGLLANAQPPAAMQLAGHIANKMKDTLSLTGQVRNLAFGVNILLHNQKTQVRQQYASLPDSMRYHLQRVENKRDSLYGLILPPNKFLLYLQKKPNLVNAL